jgi:hypothetical protein
VTGHVPPAHFQITVRRQPAPAATGDRAYFRTPVLPHTTNRCLHESPAMPGLSRVRENADSVAGDAYESATGEDIPADDSDLSGDPRGTPWDDDREGDLVRRYPRLAARFR